MKKSVILGICLLSVVIAACAGMPGAPASAPTIDLAAVSPAFDLEIKGDSQPLSMVPDVAIDSEGNVLTIDGNTIHKLDSSGQSLATWGEEGTGEGQFRFSCSTADCPPGSWGGLDVDGQGNVYVADALNCRVQKFAESGEPIALLGRPGREPGLFAQPWGVTVVGRMVFVADTENNRIQKFRLTDFL